MKKFLKIILIIVISIIAVFGIFMLFMWYIDSQNVTNDDGVAKDYFKKILTVSEAEKMYTNPWKYEISYFQQKSNNAKIGTLYIVYPKNLRKNTEKFPLIIMVNGTFTPADLYMPIFEHLASWGFVVVWNSDENSGSGKSTNATLEEILAFNSDKNSIFYNTIDIDSIWVFGHSQWGAGAINIATKFPNSSKIKSLYTASAVSSDLSRKNNWNYEVNTIQIPYFMMAWTLKSDAWLIATKKSLEENFSNIQSQKLTIMARRKNVWHKDVLEFGEGYAVAWFLFTLKNDNTAKNVFVWKHPEIKNNPNWMDVIIKMK